MSYLKVSILSLFKEKYVYFTRAFEDEKQAKLGVVECVKHGLLEPYNVLWEKEGNTMF